MNKGFKQVCREVGGGGAMERRKPNICQALTSPLSTGKPLNSQQSGRGWKGCLKAILFLLLQYENIIVLSSVRAFLCADISCIFQVISSPQNFTIGVKVKDDGVIVSRFSSKGYQYIMSRPLSAVFNCTIIVSGIKLISLPYILIIINNFLTQIKEINLLGS